MANPVLKFIISAKDEATGAFGKFFRYLDDNTRVISGKVRAAFSNLFNPQDTAAAAFEEQMQRIQSVSRASAEDFKKLETAALDMGRTTRYTSTEAAQGLEILAKAGFTADESIAALPSVLALAQGQSISMGDAASYMADTLTQFGLSADESARAANVLAKAANSANLDVNDISQSLKYVATDANMAGLSLEQTAAILDVLAKAGLRADMAGTALRDLLKDTANPASEARKALSGLGIETNDLISVIGQLSTKGVQSSAAIQEFGVRSSGAMEILVKAGVPAIQEFTDKLKDIPTYAEDARKIMDDSLKGAVFGLQSAWEGASIALEKPVLKPLAEALRGVSEQLNNFTSSGALQAIGQDLAAAFQSAGEAVVTFLQELNWEKVKTDTLSAVENIKVTLSDLGVSFANLKTGAGVALDGITIAWNAVTLTIKTVALVIHGVVATVATSVESLAFGLNKVGLVSDSAFAAIASMAEKSRQAVSDLRNSAAQDIADLGGAMGLMGDNAAGASVQTQRLADAGKALKEALPAVELSQYSESAEQLKGRLDALRITQNQANTELSAAAVALNQANEGYKNGNISLGDLQSAQARYLDALKASTDAGEAAQTVERAYFSAVTASTEAKNTAIKAESDLTKSRENAKSVIADLAAANDRMAKAEQEAQAQRKAGLITEQEYNRIRQQAKQALDEYNVALKRQADQAGNALTTAIAAREAQIKLNEANAAATEIAVARARSDADAAKYAAALIAQQQQKIQASVDLTAKLEAEAVQAQSVAEADLARYEAAAKNSALAPQAIKQAQESAAQSVELAKNKRAEADASKIKRDALLAEISAQDKAIELMGQVEDLAKRSTIADREVAEAKVEAAQKSVAVARALGDESAQRIAGNALAEAEAELAKVNAKEKRNIANAAKELVVALKEQAIQDGIITEEEQKGIDTAIKLAEAKNILANSAEKHKDKTKEVTTSTKENTQATEKNSEAQQVNIKHTEDATAAGKAQNDYLRQARKSTEELSEATRRLFDLEFSGAALRAGFDAYRAYRDAITAYKDGVDAGKAALTTFQTELNNANTLIKQSETKILAATSAWQRMDAVIELAAGKAKKAFYEQAIAAENMAQSIDRAMDGSAALLRQVIDHAESASRGLHLLDEQDLSRLQSAIDAANDKLKQMQEEAQSAKDHLAELNAELLEAQGADEKAKLLRQQLDYQQALAEIEAQRNQAELEGNRELLNTLNQQQAVLEKINRTKIANIEADVRTQAQSAGKTSSTSSSSASSSPSSSGKTYNLNLVGVGGKTLSATTTADPAAFLDALESAQRRTL